MRNCICVRLAIFAQPQRPEPKYKEWMQETEMGSKRVEEFIWGEKARRSRRKVKIEKKRAESQV